MVKRQLEFIDEIKTTTGVVKLVRDGIIMAQKNYHYSSCGMDKNKIIERWKRTYGKKFNECQIDLWDDKLGELLNC